MKLPRYFRPKAVKAPQRSRHVEDATPQQLSSQPQSELVQQTSGAAMRACAPEAVRKLAVVTAGRTRQNSDENCASAGAGQAGSSYYASSAVAATASAIDQSSDIVHLKNGATLDRYRALVIYTLLITLLEQDTFAFCELVYKCRDPEHEFYKNARYLLQGHSLVEADGTISEDVKNVVLSAVTGEDWEMDVANPIAAPKSLLPQTL